MRNERWDIALGERKFAVVERLGKSMIFHFKIFFFFNWKIFPFVFNDVHISILGSFTVMLAGRDPVSDAVRPTSFPSGSRWPRPQLLSEPAPDLRLLPGGIQRSPIRRKLFLHPIVIASRHKAMPFYLPTFLMLLPYRVFIKIKRPYLQHKKKRKNKENLLNSFFFFLN